VETLATCPLKITKEDTIRSVENEKIGFSGTEVW
jgi:hypothetical protein